MAKKKAPPKKAAKKAAPAKKKAAPAKKKAAPVKKKAVPARKKAAPAKKKAAAAKKAAIRRAIPRANNINHLLPIKFPDIGTLTKIGLAKQKLTSPVLSVDADIDLTAMSNERDAVLSQPIENFFELRLKSSSQTFLVNGQTTTLGVKASDLSLEVGGKLNAKVSVVKDTVGGKPGLTLKIEQA
jgi:hypothetical protein